MQTKDQASRLRALVGAAARTRTIAVCSGKGGVGKSNIAVNLSILMSAAGGRVALVDADLGLANLDVLLNIDVKSDLSNVVAGTRRLDQIIIQLPCGVQLVPGASGLVGLTCLSEFERASLLHQLTALEADNDTIIIDCGAGIGPDVIRFAAGADNAMVVTTPEPTAITDGYAVIKMLRQRGYDGHVSVLINQVNGRAEARRTYQRIADVARQFLGLTVFEAGYVLTDPRVQQAVRNRQPVVLAFPQCPASRCLARIARKLGEDGLLAERKEGFFRRVAKWFA